MRTNPALRIVHVVLPAPEGSRVHRIEMSDVVTGRDIRVDLEPRVWTSNRPSPLDRAVRWIRELAGDGE